MTSFAFFVGRDGALEWRETGPLTPGEGQVLIAVRAAGVNRPDLLQRQGLYPPPPGASEALGLEVAGRVAAVGQGVRRFAVGDDVMALVPGGGYATHALADEGATMPVPPGMGFVEAAAFPETAFTVWTNVVEDARLARGERLFVHGATSGIGTMAASVALALGAEVYGTAGTAEKIDAARRHGFTGVWNHREEDWSAAMQGLGGCDVVLDMVGGDYVPRNLAMLRPGGRHVSIAFLGGMEAKVPVLTVMQKRLTLTGSTLRARPKAEKARLRASVEAGLLPLVTAGRVRPLVTLRLPIAEAEAAHRAMDDGRLVGKAVLEVDG